jgi:multiple sugar transport system permease protein
MGLGFGHRLKSEANWQGWLSVLPVIVIILAIRGFPMGWGVAMSFTNWDGLFRQDFIGLKNYFNIFGDRQFWLLLKNNLVLLLYLPIQLFLGLVAAVMLYEKVRGWRFFRSIYYLPQVLSSLSIGYLFVILFSYDGPLNQVLRAAGLESLAIEWLGKSASALLVIIICMVWINIGWQGLLFLGGMSLIPPSVYEAATLDGAGYWTKLFKITLPLLVRTLEYSCIMSVLWCFTGLFSLIFSITKGGPGYETTTVDYMIYLKAFRGGSEFGYASTIAVILLLIVMGFTFAQMRAANRADVGSE